MKDKVTLSGYQVRLRDLEQDDLEMVRQWRNHPDIREHMVRQALISREQQQTWFRNLQDDPSQRHWLILYRDRPIGVAYLKTLEASETLASATCVEPGLYIADLNYRGNILAFAPTLLLNDYCFDELGVRVLRATVKEANSAALRYNQRLGYEEVGRANGLVIIELTPDTYRSASAPIKAFLSRPGKH